jgi:hypothetical protein
MTDYISREAALNVNFRVNVNSFESRITTAKRAVQTYADEIAKLPAADVRPVVRGKWIKELHPNVRYYQYKCSICGEFSGHDSEGWIWEPNFCPNCGADMREEN